MIRKFIAVLLLTSSCSFVYAQTIKTDVLVIGRTPGGIAAAIQSARSKVKTILTGPVQDMPTGVLTGPVADLPSGIWSEFRMKIQEFYKRKPGPDPGDDAALKLETGAAELTFKKITDTVKNLTIYPNWDFTSVKKDGDRWEVRIGQNEKTITIKARVLVDATEHGAVAAKLNLVAAEGLRHLTYQSRIYRTSIASAGNLTFVPLRAVVPGGAENILVTNKIMPAEKNIQSLPLQISLGQGVGATAAYCAFFKTTTKNLKARTIQGEILDFNGRLLPFADISYHDADWRSIQQVAVTGMLKGTTGGEKNAQLFFRPDSLVSTAEIKPVLTEIYTRAFLWFNREKPGDKFTIGNMLSLISDYTLTEPQVLKVILQKAWKSQYKFKFDFNPERSITRREFAVLANKFLNPFARTVDLEGRLIN